MKAAIYYRVSTALQTTANQVPEVEAAVARLGLSVVEVYSESASAAKARPEFDRMMAAARAREFGVLVIWSLDRFGRSLSGNVNDFMALDAAGVRVVSVREPWVETSGPVRDLLISIFSWVAQQERARLIERTRAGIARAKAEGKTWGRRSGSLVMADPVALEAAVRSWGAGRAGGYRGLAKLLGGVSPMTARREALRVLGTVSVEVTAEALD